MFNVLIRAVIIFLFVFAVMRLMGKRQIGEMQPFELVITIIISEVACIPMADVVIPLSHGIIPIIVLGALHFLLSFLARKSIVLRRWISGNPIIVVDPNGINYENLKKLNMNVHDLIEALRTAEYFNFEEVKYAIFETNGKLCVIPYETDDQPTCEDLKVKREPAALPVALLVDGKFLKENLELTGITIAEAIKMLHKNGENNYKKLSMVTIDNNGKLYIQPKYGKFKTGQHAVPNPTW
ncbi:hypothetical protein FACS1894211_05660 [Clostridia bacterium]|nr:hypothetical protein FACS1894211_05660 [Clostridia bacterium]